MRRRVPSGSTPPSSSVTALTAHLTSYSDVELVTLAENHPDCQHPLVQEVLVRLAQRTGHALGRRDLRSKFQREAQRVNGHAR